MKKFCITSEDELCTTTTTEEEEGEEEVLNINDNAIIDDKFTASTFTRNDNEECAPKNTEI